MRKTIFVMALAAVTLGAAAYFQGGSSLAWEGLRRGGSTFYSVIPLLLAAYIVGGMAAVLLPREVVQKWLGTQSGWRGIFLGTAAGAITPGGPYVYYPLAATLKKAGAGVGTLVGYISGKALWDITRVPMELALLGPFLTVHRWLFTFFAPVVISFLAFRLLTRESEEEH